MNIETKKNGRLICVKLLSQNIDATVSNEFKGRMNDLIQQGNNFFILNLSQVKFIDSSGLGALISILKTLTLNNGDIVLCELNGPVQSLLKITRMENIFKICPNEEEGTQFLTNAHKFKNNDIL